MKKILLLAGILFLTSPIFARPIAYDIVMEKLPGEEYWTSAGAVKSTGTTVNILIATDTATLVIATTTLNGWDNGPILVQNQSADNYYCGYNVNVSTYMVTGDTGRRGTVIYAGSNMIRTLTKETVYYCRSAGTTPTYIHLEKLGFRQ
jgi:hypothetical protein